MEMCPTTHSYAHLAHSSVGQSSGLIIRRSWDHAPLGPLKKVANRRNLFLYLRSESGGQRRPNPRPAVK